MQYRIANVAAKFGENGLTFWNLPYAANSDQDSLPAHRCEFEETMVGLNGFVGGQAIVLWEETNRIGIYCVHFVPRGQSAWGELWDIMGQNLFPTWHYVTDRSRLGFSV